MSQRTEEKETKLDARSILLLGCGHGSFCGHAHPKETFITVDSDPSVKPDICFDLRDEEKFSEALEKSDKNYTAIIYEKFPFHLITFNLRKHLNDQGAIIIVGGDILDLIDKTPLNDDLWIGNLDVKRDEIFLLQKHPEQKLLFGQDLQKYLNSIIVGPLQDAFQTKKITENVKLRGGSLSHFVLRDTFQYPTKILMDAVFYDQKEAPLTVSRLKMVTAKYTPGFWRSTFTGETKGMNDLKRFLGRFEDDNHQLDERELSEVLAVIKERIGRIRADINPTRSSEGQTTQIFNEIAALVLNQVINKGLTKTSTLTP